MKKACLTFILCGFMLVPAFAQKAIWGVITDENRKPVQGAVVRVKNMRDSVLTDEKGRFWLDNAYPNRPVTVSKPQYTSREFVPGPVLYFEIVLSKRRSPIRLLN